jgi:gluconokinase
MAADRPPVIVLMGVSGAGKTTVGRKLAEALHRPFIDGDDLHPVANVAKMSAGIPLTDDDREPWLEALNSAIRELKRNGLAPVVACSALKQRYRIRLAEGIDEIIFIHLRADPAALVARLSERRDHYMPPALLDSQFETLEEPVDALTVDANMSPELIVDTILKAI